MENPCLAGEPVLKYFHTGRGAVWLAHLHGVQGVAGSSPVAPIRKQMDLGPQQIGKLLIAIGLTIVLIGTLFILLGQLGFFKLPGNLNFGSKNLRVFIPITSCIIISILLTLIFCLISYLRR
jgi:hypothetical protein